MKTKSLLCIMIAMTVATAHVSFAQGNRERGREAQQHGGDREDRRDDQRRPPQRERDNPAQRDERGAGPDHAFHRGERLPPQYHNRQYVVDDWRGHHLSAPPRGYHWVQTGGDYVLVAIASGIIAQLLLGR